MPVLLSSPVALELQGPPQPQKGARLPTRRAHSHGCALLRVVSWGADHSKAVLQTASGQVGDSEKRAKAVSEPLETSRATPGRRRKPQCSLPAGSLAWATALAGGL